MDTLKSLDPIKIPLVLGGEKLYLRYNLNARRYLEEFIDLNEVVKKSDNDWTAEEVCHLLRAGLIDCYFNKNEKAIEERNFSAIKPSLATVGRLIDDAGMAEITKQILDGIVASLPVPSQGNFQTGVKN